MMRCSKYLVIVFLVFSFPGVFAQPGSVKTEVHNGQKCYVHEVERGSTLFGISKLYDVKVDDIVKFNPGSDEKLRPGDILYIPVHQKLEVANESLNDTISCKTHLVKRGETIYGICRQYSVTEKDLKAANAFLETSSLQPGMELCIPKQASTLEGNQTTATEGIIPPPAEKDTVKVIRKDSLHRHVVRQGETLYALSKRYMLLQDDIKKANNGLVNGLKTGDTLIIPLELIVNRDVIAVDVPGKDSVGMSLSEGNKKEQYKVIYFVPLFLYKNTQHNTSSLRGREVYGPTLDGVNFYMGANKALDSLKKAGLNLDVHFFDSAKDTATVAKILRSDKMNDVDLIIGPFYSSTLKLVLDFADSRSIPLIVPVPQSNKILYQHPSVVKTIPSRSSKVEAMARYIATHHAGSNVILLLSKKEKEEGYYALFREVYNRLKASGNYPGMTDLRETGVDHYAKAVKGQMTKSGMNVFVIPSSDLSFVSNTLTRLVGVRNSYDYYNAEFCVFGFDDWERWVNIDAQSKHRVNLHLAAATFIDYDSIATNQFIRDFRKMYRTDPNEFGFLGFDVTYTYVAALSAYGTGLINKLDGFRSDGLHLDVKLERIEPGSGMENRHVHILKYLDYDLIEAGNLDEQTKDRR